MKVVLLGDSLTEYFPMDMLKEANADIINCGVGGETVAEIGARVQADAISNNPDKVIIQGGANDFQLAFYPGAKELAKKILGLAMRVKDGLPKAKVYVESLYPAYTDAIGNMPSWAKNRTNEEMMAINKELKKICEEKGIPYVDIFSKLVGESGQLPLEYTIDGIHLSRKGYEIVAKEIIPLLKRRFR